MPKDPAFLFYPNDYVGGTMTMSFIQKGAYVDLLILQFNKGPFTKSDIKNILRGQFEKIWPALEDKFIHEEGKYYNQRLKNEIEKRTKYAESRRANRKSESAVTKIYLIRDDDSGKTKIGASIHPHLRLSELKKHSAGVHPSEKRNYRLIYYSSDVPASLEFDLQNEFRSKVYRGEWFSLTDNDIEYVKSYVVNKGHHMINHMENRNENRNSEKGVEGENVPIGSEKVSEIANEVWKDQKWRDSLCMGMNIKEGELKKWMAQFNSSIANDVINNFNQHSYKKIIRGWIANEQGKGRTINTTNRESLSAPLKHLS